MTDSNPDTPSPPTGVETTTNLDQEQQAFTKTLLEGLRLGDGWLPEAWGLINDASRKLIEAVHQAYGQAWLGNVNIRDKGGVILWQWTPGETVCNFAAAFVVPQYDADLERLIRERADAPYEGTQKDAERVEAIMERLTALGGFHLYWA